MKLPTEKTKKIKDLALTNILLYGNPKVGKSTLASQFPKGLFLATEKGYNFLEVYKVDILCWEDLLSTLVELRKEKTFTTLIIDTVDHLYRFCETYVCKKNGVEHASDLPFGKGFNLIKKEFVDTINNINQYGFGLVFISHSKQVEAKSKVMTFTKMQTSLAETAQTVISGMCDLILYCYIDKDGKRLIRTKPSETVLAGDRTKNLPKDIDMDYEILLTEFIKATKE